MQYRASTKQPFLYIQALRVPLAEEAIVSTVPKSDTSVDRSKIAAIRQSWIEAVKDGDVKRLAVFMTDGVVAVRKDGRCTCGRNTIESDLLAAFGLYDVDRRILSSELIIRDNWAFEIDEMDSTVTPIREGNEIRAHVKTVVVYARQPDGSWKVARLQELLD